MRAKIWIASLSQEEQDSLESEYGAHCDGLELAGEALPSWEGWLNENGYAMSSFSNLDSEVQKYVCSQYVGLWEPLGKPTFAAFLASSGRAP